MNINIKNYLIISLSTLIYFSFFLGFYFGENSIGSGGYKGDLTWMLKNLEIFQTNTFFDAIHHPEFFGNRTPLIYILHAYLNPFVSNVDTYRLSVFVLSFASPIILYICLVQKFTNTNKKILFFISSFILLSPFYRTSAYWGLEVNYAITTMLLSIYFLNILQKKKNINNLSSYVLISLLTFTSSLCIYFDQKFLIIPLLIFIYILKSEIKLKFKVYSIINYSIFSVPFFYLIFLWKGIVPPSTQYANPNTITSVSRLNQLWFEHLGYASTMIAFYFLPLVFFKKDNFLIVARNFFLEKKNYLFLIPFLIYIIYFTYYVDFYGLTKGNYLMGLGFIHKISLILFEDVLLQEIFTCFSFLSSSIIILLFLDKNLNNFLILFYFYFLSLILWPLMQEYFDPIIFLFALTIFSSKLIISYKNSTFVFLYLSIFLICANVYYY